MFYYEHHIGDFIRETARLSDSQSMAYLRLLWMYYDTEKPLSGTIEKLAFIVGANPSDVALILDHYFDFDGEVYRQKRCDLVISEYQNKSTNGRNAANARWKNANAPKNDANAMQTDSGRNANAPKNDANQEPITNNQEPKKKSSAIAPPTDVVDSVWADWLALRKAKRAPVTQTVIDSARREADKALMTFEDFLRVWCARGSQGLEASWLTKNQANSPPIESNYAKSMRLKMEQIAPMIAAKDPSIPRINPTTYFENLVKEQNEKRIAIG